MLDNFIYAKKKSLFENALNNDLVLNEAIVFIEDTKEIWNHGTYFGGSTFDPSNIEKSIENIINNKADKTELPTKTSDLTNDSGFITINEIPEVTVPTKVSDLTNDANYITQTTVDDAIDDLASVAKSGSYNDLKNKPTIPSAVTESTVSGWGFTKNTGTYTKPSTGIPKSDLASAVQISLGKADTALQSYTEQYKGTVTGVKINGTTKNPSNGVVDLGYVNKQLSGSTSSSMTLSPNIYYRNTSTSLSTLTIRLAFNASSDIMNEYFVEFTTSSSGTTVSLPSSIRWANGEAPTFEASTTYQISIVNFLGVVTKFK